MAIINDEDKKKMDNKPLGVSDYNWDKANSSFVQSEDSKKADAEVQEGRDYISKVVSEPIISYTTKNKLNNNFETPSAVTKADAWLSTQLQKIQSGKTSYSDQVKDMMDKIMNREKFSYDVDKDPLFQQALASAMNSGKQAMQDTIGQASALTGGYGSSYATTAGNQAYNSFIEDAYDNLPQYYQMAMEAYQMEGDQLYQQYGMLSTEDAKEYERMLGAYDATYAHRNQMYNEAYGQFRDEKSDAFAMANLEATEHGQRVNDAQAYYNAASDYATNRYTREYTSWADSINQAWQAIQMQNSDYWNQSNQDFTAFQNQLNRDHESAENQKNRDFNASEAEKDRAFTASENAKNRAASASRSGGSGGSGYDYSAEDMEKASKSEATKSFKSALLTEREFVKRGKSATINGKKVRYDTYNEYIDATLEKWRNDGKLTENETAYLAGYYFR